MSWKMSSIYLEREMNWASFALYLNKITPIVQILCPLQSNVGLTSVSDVKPTLKYNDENNFVM